MLDIGCGWGGLALYLAEICGAHVTGITLSEEQFRRAQNRAVERGRTQEATFRLIDYRDVDGRFDRIVSVGMFEHVGVGFYDAFFGKCAHLLDDDGVMLLAFIGRKSTPGITNPWIAKYIFPGGYIPALSEVLPAIERARLIVTDIEVLQLHYAETLKAWRERFLAHRDEVVRLYDQRFVRMWEFYLASSEMAFRDGDMVVFQIQMAKRKGITPATRDYIGARGSAVARARSRPRAAIASRRRIVARCQAAERHPSRGKCGVTVPCAARWVTGKAANGDFPSPRRWTIDSACVAVPPSLPRRIRGRRKA